MVHYVAAIQSHGSLDGFNTKSPEQLHIDYTKEVYQASNKKDYVQQMMLLLLLHGLCLHGTKNHHLPTPFISPPSVATFTHRSKYILFIFIITRSSHVLHSHSQFLTPLQYFLFIKNKQLHINTSVFSVPLRCKSRYSYLILPCHSFIVVLYFILFPAFPFPLLVATDDSLGGKTRGHCLF